MRNLNTKEARESSREYQFEWLTKNGYEHTTYKKLDFFTKQDGKYYTLKVFKGTAANHIHYMNYHTAERRAQIIENFKRNFDGREAFNAEQKEKNKGKSSSHAGAAAAIKAELKAAFPFTKFSVKSETYAGGNSVNITWKDGQTVEQVEKFTAKYQYGSFNGMEDLYEYTNSRSDIPQVKYVQEYRELSDEIIKQVAEQLKAIKSYTDEQLNSYHENPEREAAQLLYKTEIPQTFTGLKVIVNPDSQRYSDFFKVIFDTLEQPQAAKEETAAAPETTGKIQIIDYSEKSFAVIGETKVIKDQLKQLGGSFNPRLNCGAGWIFSKKKLDEVKAFLIAHKQGAAQATEQPATLKDEINKTVHFFAETDKKLFGEVTEQTKQIAKIQAVEILPETYNNLQDLTEAANSGKVISLFNLCQLVNTK